MPFERAMLRWSTMTVPGSPTFRIVLAVFACAIAFSLYTAPSDAGDTTARPVALAQLLNAPLRYAGKAVTVRGYLARGGQPGALYAGARQSGDAGSGVELLDPRAATEIAANPALAACLSNADVEVTGTFGHLHAEQYVLLSLQRIGAVSAGRGCRWSRPGF